MWFKLLPFQTFNTNTLNNFHFLQEGDGFWLAAEDCTTVVMATTDVAQAGVFLSWNCPHLPGPVLESLYLLMSWLLLCFLSAASSETSSLGGSAGMLTCVCSSSPWDSSSQTISFLPRKTCGLDPFPAPLHHSPGFRRNKTEHNKCTKGMWFIIFPLCFFPPEVRGEY